MRRYRVVFTADARRDYKREAKKWRLSHPRKTYLLEEEVSVAIKVLRAVPRYGEAAGDAQLAGARRVVLQKSEFLLYYYVHDDERRVSLLRL